jgi:uncharacterized protein with FMN-binding domain
MKKFLTAALCSAVGMSLVACGGSDKTTSATTEAVTVQETAAETLTGSAKGFGGDVTATLTVENGTITGCDLEGADETPEVGGKALTELSEQVVAANGAEIDGVAGATITSNAVKKAVAAALGEESEEAETEAKEVETAAPAEIVEIEGGIQIGQAYGAAHGTKCFTEAVAVVKDDVIIAAYLDDFQFMGADTGVTGVPNSDADFGENFADGQVLASKRVNAAYYSEMMAGKAGSTVAIDANYDAIQSYVVGKTIDEVAEAAGKSDIVDAVSGATLVDTAGYLGVIADAARAAQETQAVEFDGNSDDLKLNVVYAAAHGTKCFTSAAALTDGENVVLSYIDEFQFMPSDADVTGVPNSDADFGENFAEGQVLASKRVNAEYYSSLMTDHAGATVAIDANYDAIQNHINGMTIAEANALSDEAAPVDAISGATLVDTANYIKAVVEAAQQ